MNKVGLLLTGAVLLSGCASSEESALAEFREIAIASCEKARTEGVLEHTANNSYQAVLVPAESAINNYSAAWVDESGYALIFETDFFLACAEANTFALYEESGMEPVIEVTRTADGFLTKSTENPRLQSMQYRVQDGLLIAASNQDASDPMEILIYYAPELKGSLEILSKAISAFEESQN